MAAFELDLINTFIDSRGKLRHTFRRKGHKRITIKGRPGSPEFMDHYHALLAASGGPMADIGASRTRAGTIDALIVRYLQHDVFKKGLARATQAMRRSILDAFRQCVTPGGRRYGENRLATIQRKSITDALAGKTPNVQRSWMIALRHLIAFAIDHGECRLDPTAGIKTARLIKSGGYMTWGDVQIALYRAGHPLGTMARLAMELMLAIAARRHDAHLLGRQHLRDGCLTWRPSKTARSTGKMLTIRVMPELQAAIDAMPPSDELTFLLTEYGRPFASATSFGNKFGIWCVEAGLEPVKCDDGKVRAYRAHGLRKAALTQLAHASATGAEMMAVSGHSSLAQVQPYIADAEQRRMADAG